MFRVVVTLCFIASFVFAKECVSCHKVEPFEPTHHNFTCKACHLLPNKREDFTHEDIITHSTSLQYVDFFCAKCHKKQIKALKNSTHFTHKNEIQTILQTFNFDSNATLQTLKDPKNLETPKELVIDMMRRKCLKCHLENQASGEKGMYRGKGCMACHGSYNLHGTYRGKDKHLRGKKPYASLHVMSKPKDSTCLSCHNKEFVGSDYFGLFPKDYDKAYRAPLSKKGKFPRTLFGASYHRLQQDIHAKRKLTCNACHKGHNAPKPTCTSCHKAKQSVAHEKYHKNLSCTACHASWQMSNYELNLLLDKTKAYKRWENLIYQEDGYLANFLKANINAKKPKEPLMPDWLTKENKKGIWYSGWRIRRWENLLLGNDENKIVKILRPMFEYRLTYKDENGTLIINDLKAQAFTPYSPHTISKYAKSCESCHENPLLTENKELTHTAKLFRGRVLKGSKLTKKQREKLGSKKYRKIRARMLLDKNF